MAKKKLSITVDSQTAAELDRLGDGRTRSEIVEEAIVAWLQRHRRQTLNTDIERYYRELSPVEREEDAEWADLGGQAW